jgi:hypothetical protein
MPEAVVTSIAREAGWAAHESSPTTASVEAAGRIFADALARRLEEAALPAEPARLSLSA